MSNAGYASTASGALNHERLQKAAYAEAQQVRPSASRSELLVQSIGQSLQRIETLNNRLAELADRTLGPRPREGVASNGHPEPPVTTLASKLELLDRASGMLAAALNENIEALESFV